MALPVARKGKIATPLTTSEICIQITDCKFVARSAKKDSPDATEKMLRFTLTWSVQLKNGKVMGQQMSGCLAYRIWDPKQERLALIWSPPRTMLGKSGFYKQTVINSHDLHQAVLRTLEVSPYAQYIGERDQRNLQGGIAATDVDSTLPPILEYVDNNEADPPQQIDIKFLEIDGGTSGS